MNFEINEKPSMITYYPLLMILQPRHEKYVCAGFTAIFAIQMCFLRFCSVAPRVFNSGVHNKLACNHYDSI